MRRLTPGRVPAGQRRRRGTRPAGPVALRGMNTYRRILILAVILAAVIVGAVTLLSSPSNEDHSRTITTHVDTLDGSPDRDKAIVVPAAAVAQAAAGLTGEAAKANPAVTVETADHTDGRDESPANVPAAELAANTAAIATNRATTEALPTAGASGGIPGCRTAFVRNQSSRRGVRPTVQVLHYTVSPNRPGWSDVDGIVAFFNRSATQASSNFVIDAEGNCAYIVPIEAKAWTQAGGNPWAVSYEIVDNGNEAAFMQTAGYARLGAVMREVSRRTGIPMRPGRISGCVPSRSGIVQHADGGTCWGGHHDIRPFPFASIVAKLGANPCDARCARTRDLRARHTATHAELKARSCAPIDRTRSARCLALHRRDRALHKAAGAAGITL